jgi:hypothetical protein
MKLFIRFHCEAIWMLFKHDMSYRIDQSFPPAVHCTFQYSFCKGFSNLPYLHWIIQRTFPTVVEPSFFANDIDFNLYFSFCEMLHYKTLFIVGLYLGPIYHYFLHFRRWTYVKNILIQNNMIIASTLRILLQNITIMCLCILLCNGRTNKHKPETHIGV